ncbi:MAG: DUF4846 domain-containing protein [Myxococcota bacterium]
MHAWLVALTLMGPTDTVVDRVPPPSGYTRVPAAAGSFGAHLRALSLKPGQPPVRLYDGREKRNQGAHLAVYALSVGEQDLQQCADSIIRVRADWLRAQSRDDEICFRFTSGDAASWKRWRNGERPQVKGNRVKWATTAARDDGERTWREYLETVFMYAGTYSLRREMTAVADPRDVRMGDVFIQGGFPGHVVIVVDVAENPDGDRVFLLAQGYTPAQDFHLLRNPSSATSPWYRAEDEGELVTPEWTFQRADLRRFPTRACAGNR